MNNMITDGQHTFLTTEAEKGLVELGGGDPQSKLTNEALSEALVNAIDALAEHHSPVLVKLYRQCAKSGHVPPLETLLDENELEELEQLEYSFRKK